MHVGASIFSSLTKRIFFTGFFFSLGTSFSLVDPSSDNDISSTNKLKLTQTKFSESLREACLPKLLCEMAARPAQTLTDRERNLLQLIK